MITNYLSPLEFIVIVSRLPNVEFFTQRTTIPNISTNPIEKPSPLNPTFQPGDRLNYAELDLNFIVDEDMSNYIEIFDWVKKSSFPENFGQYRSISDSLEGLTSDITIKILNSHKNPSIQIDYYNCFPINLSAVVLDTTQTDITYPEATATFRYDYFDIQKISS